MDYEVVWRIEIDAKSAKQAAQEALRIQRDGGSTATVFEVTPKTGNNRKMSLIDLDK